MRRADVERMLTRSFAICKSCEKQARVRAKFSDLHGLSIDITPVCTCGAGFSLAAPVRAPLLARA